jgi:phosphoglycolate phosphatase-like HAD superfamily hydrolase
MLGVAFGLAPGDAGYEPLRDEFLARYAERLLQQSPTSSRRWSRCSPALERLRHALGHRHQQGLRFAEPVVEGLGSLARAAVVVAATPRRTPSRTRRRCSRRRGAWPACAVECIYVGDDLRDVQAGRAAGMATLAAGLGLPRHRCPWTPGVPTTCCESPAALELARNWPKLRTLGTDLASTWVRSRRRACRAPVRS